MTSEHPHHTLSLSLCYLQNGNQHATLLPKNAERRTMRSACNKQKTCEPHIQPVSSFCYVHFQGVLEAVSSDARV